MWYSPGCDLGLGDLVLDVGHSRSADIETAPAGAKGPVLLATLGVPFEPAAAEFAVDAAVETGAPFIVVNVVEMVLGPSAIVLGTSWELHDEADTRALAAPAGLAASLGVKVERLRVCSPHPIDALIQVIGECAPSLLVFGPDRTRLRRRRYRKAVEAVSERVACLVWLAD